MVKLLVASQDHLSATAYYRTWGVFKYINSLSKSTGIQIEAYQMPKKLDWRTIQDSDIVYFERPFMPEDLNKIGMLKKMGVPVWVDYDDNLYDIQADNPAYEYYPKRIHPIIKECVELADVVTVSTDNLAKHYASKNTKVIRNALPKELLNRPLKKEQDNYIVWRGGMSHEGDVYCYWDEIKALLKRFQVMFLGATPNFIKYEAKKNHNIKIIPPMPLENYLTTLFSISPKAFIVPLDDNEFNKGKSNIAALEALVTGAMAVTPKWHEWNLLDNTSMYDSGTFFDTAIKTMDGYNRSAIAKAREALSDSYRVENTKRVEIIKSLLDHK